MKGATRLTRRFQNQETNPTTISRVTKIETTSQNNPYNQTSSYKSQRTTTTTTSLSNKQKEQNPPIKITIKTTYEKGYNNQNEKIKEKPEENNNRKHFQKLTMEERKRFARGIRPSQAQREADALEKQRQNQQDEMIEIIDKTDYSKINNNKNIKLRPNKKVLINRKKETNTELKPNLQTSGINQINIRRNSNNNQQNKNNIQLIPNKKTVIVNPKVQNSLPVAQNPKLRNYSKKEEKPIINPQENKRSTRNNTVSHTIIEKRKTEPKPYVLKERKTDVIKFSHRALQKYNDSIIGNKDEPYRSNDNHRMIVTRNVTKEDRTKHSYDPNLKNTSSHKIDVTKKEPKKEVVVQPRQLTVIRSVIPSRLHHLTEANENLNKNNKTYNYSRKIQTDKKIPTSNITQKIGNVVKDNKSNQQPYQPRINYRNANDNKINKINNEPQKQTKSYISRFNKSSASKPQQNQQQVPSYQNSRIKRDYPKQPENKYILQQKTYNSTNSRTKLPEKPEQNKQNLYSIKTQEQKNTENKKESQENGINSGSNNHGEETQIKNSSLDDISFIYKSQNNNSGIDNKSDYSPLYSVSSQGKNSLEENMPDTSKSKYNLYILILFYYRNGERCRKRK